MSATNSTGHLHVNSETNAFPQVPRAPRKKQIKVSNGPQGR